MSRSSGWGLVSAGFMDSVWGFKPQLRHASLTPDRFILEQSAYPEIYMCAMSRIWIASRLNQELIQLYNLHKLHTGIIIVRFQHSS